MLDNFDNGKGPVERWVEIVRGAGENVCADELERLLEMLAVFELKMEKDGAEFRKIAAEFSADEIHAAKQNLAIESMGNILGNFE